MVLGEKHGTNYLPCTKSEGGMKHERINHIDQAGEA